VFKSAMSFPPASQCFFTLTLNPLTWKI